MKEVFEHARPLSGDAAGPLPRREHVRLALRLGALFASAAGFILLMQLVRGGSVNAFDLHVHAWVLAHRRPALNEVAISFTALGSQTLLTVATMLVATLLWTSRRRLAALDAACASSLAALITSTLKATVARPRPPLAGHLALATGYSFPSGHSSGIAALLTATALHTIEAAASTGQRWALAAFHLLLLLAVGGSRVYLGVHYASDVAAGLCLGVACGLTAHGLLRTHLAIAYLRRHLRRHE